MADGQVTIQIKGDDSQYLRTVESLGAKTKARLSKTAADVNKAIGGIGKAAGVAAAAVGAVSAAAAAFGGAAIKTGMEFEESMSTVAATAGISGEALDKLTAKAKQMGAETQFSASQAAEAMNYMAMAGWKTEDMLGGIEGIMNLAAASGEDLATTSDIVTDALTAFGMTAQDSGHFADILAAASSNANTNVGMMGETFKYVAPLAGALGYAAEDMATAIGLMANSGIKGSQSGTALRGMLTRLSKPTKESSEAMKALDLSITNADGTMKPFMQVMEDMRDRFAGLGEAEKAQYAAMLAGQEGMSGLLAIVNASEADFEKLTGAITSCDGAAKQMADTRMDNLAGDVKLLKSAFEGLQIGIAESANGMSREFIQSISGMLTEMNQAYAENGIDGMLDAFAKGFPKLVTKVISIAEKLVAAVVRKLPDLLKQLVGALPGVLEGLLEDRPGIVEAMFGAVSAVAEQLISDLPRLVPMLVNGVLNLAGSVVRGIASSGLNLTGALLKVLMGEGHSGVQEAWDSMVDDDIVLKMTSVTIEPPPEIDTSETENRIHTAYNNIYNALNTPILTDAQQAEIRLMIGSGYRAIYNKLLDFGLPPERAAELATKITTAYGTIASTLETTSLLSPEQITAIQGVVDDGYQAVYDMLIGFGLPEGTAAQISARVTAAYQSAAGAVEGCTYLTGDQKATILGMIGGDYEQIYDTLRGFGVPEGTAAEIAGKVSGVYSDIANEITALTLLTPDQQTEILGMIGSSYDEIYNKLLSFNMTPEQAALVAHDIVTTYGIINNALRTPILGEAQTEAVVGAIEGGYDAVYQALLDSGFDPEEAAATAKTITDSFNEIVSAFGSLDLKKFGLTPTQLGIMVLKARGSKVAFLAQCKAMKLSNTDIAELSGIWDENVAAVQAATPNMIAAIYDKLTNGKIEDDDVDLLTSMKDSAIAADLKAVQDWLNTEIEKLDPNDPKYTEKITALHTQADEWSREIMSVDTEMTGLIESLAGQPSTVVQQRIAEFEALERRANALAERLEQVNAEGRSQAEQDYERVTGGTTTNETRIATAQALSAQMRDKQLEELNKTYEQLMASATDAQTEQRINEWFDAQVAAVNSVYGARGGEILQGVLKAFSGLEGYEWIDQLQTAMSLDDVIQQYYSTVGTEGADSEAAQALKQRIQEMFSSAFGVDASEMGVTQMADQVDQMIGNLFASVDPENTAFASVIQGLIEQGIFDGVEGVDPSSIMSVLTMLFSGTFPVPEGPVVDINPDVKLSDSGEIVEKTSAELKAELSDGIPVEATAEVTTDDITVNTGESSSIEAAAKKELEAQTMGVKVDASVSLNVSVSDSNGAEVGNAAGVEIGNAIGAGIRAASGSVNTAAKAVATGAGSAAKSTEAYQRAQTAGQFAMSGFAAGMRSNAAEIYKLAKEIADNVARTMANALEIKSPSRVTMQLGEFTGEGYGIGLRNSLQNAVSTAENIVTGMRLNGGVSDFESAIGGAVSSAYAAESVRPIYLIANGKVIARVLDSNIQQASNNANRRIGLGVGK